MTEAELQLSLIYTGAFKDKTRWSPEDHLAGLKAVFAAGARAHEKATAPQVTGERTGWDPDQTLISRADGMIHQAAKDISDQRESWLQGMVHASGLTAEQFSAVYEIEDGPFEQKGGRAGPFFSQTFRLQPRLPRALGDKENTE